MAFVPGVFCFFLGGVGCYLIAKVYLDLFGSKSQISEESGWPCFKHQHSSQHRQWLRGLQNQGSCRKAPCPFLLILGDHNKAVRFDTVFFTLSWSIQCKHTMFIFEHETRVTVMKWVLCCTILSWFIVLENFLQVNFQKQLFRKESEGYFLGHFTKCCFRVATFTFVPWLKICWIMKFWRGRLTYYWCVFLNVFLFRTSTRAASNNWGTRCCCPVGQKPSAPWHGVLGSFWGDVWSVHIVSWKDMTNWYHVNAACSSDVLWSLPTFSLTWFNFVQTTASAILSRFKSICPHTQNACEE